MSFIEKQVLRAAHPRQIIIKTVCWTWAMYFVWLHNWVWALATLVLAMLAGMAAAPSVSPELLARTTLGKLALLHLHPANISIQLIGTAVLFYGLWGHSAVTILLAMSAVMIGHLWGWHQVSEAL